VVIDFFLFFFSFSLSISFPSFFVTFLVSSSDFLNVGQTMIVKITGNIKLPRTHQTFFCEEKKLDEVGETITALLGVVEKCVNSGFMWLF
jgi:hypothetical protein